jgi:diguanylate cyclase (GGDEF)-like protein/PAS domain S-box-containing protein
VPLGEHRPHEPDPAALALEVVALRQELARTQAELAEARALAELVERSPHPALVHDGRVVLWANDAAAHLVELESGQAFVGTPLVDVVEPASQRTAWERIAATLRGEPLPTPGEFVIRTRSGRRVVVETRASRTVWRGVPAVYIVVWDVTARREHAAQLAWAATHDTLTGLLNRDGIRAHLDHDLGARPCPDPDHTPAQVMAVLLLDLDGFKAVNDRNGHAAGDAFLQAVAAALQRTAGDHPLGRLGGDEFLCLLRDPAPGEPEALAERLAAAVAETAQPQNPPTADSATTSPAPAQMPARAATDAAVPAVTASIGVAIGRTGQVSPSVLLAAADAAMYRAKRRGVSHETVDLTSVPSAPVRG